MSKQTHQNLYPLSVLNSFMDSDHSPADWTELIFRFGRMIYTQGRFTYDELEEWLREYLPNVAVVDRECLAALEEQYERVERLLDVYKAEDS